MKYKKCPKFKPGDWVYFHGKAFPEFITSYWRVGKVCQVEEARLSNPEYWTVGSGAYLSESGNSGGTNDAANFRLATNEEIERHLLELI